MKQYQESLSTLQFGTRCKEIEVRNVDRNDEIIKESEEVRGLKDRVKCLERERKDMLDKMENNLKEKGNVIQELE